VKPGDPTADSAAHESCRFWQNHVPQKNGCGVIEVIKKEKNKQIIKGKKKEKKKKITAPRWWAHVKGKLPTVSRYAVEDTVRQNRWSGKTQTLRQHCWSAGRRSGMKKPRGGGLNQKPPKNPHTQRNKKRKNEVQTFPNVGTRTRDGHRGGTVQTLSGRWWESRPVRMTCQVKTKRGPTDWLRVSQQWWGGKSWLQQKKTTDE